MPDATETVDAISNFDIDKILAIVKSVIWKIWKIPFEFFNSLPLPVKIIIKTIFWIVLILIARNVYLNRDEWLRVSR